MVTILGGLLVVVAALIILAVEGLSINSGLMFLSGPLLMINGVIRLQRLRMETAVAASADPDVPVAPRVRLLEQITATHILLVVAVLEVAINRVAVPMFGPLAGEPPTWHTLLDYAGLFLFYFTGVLAALVIAQRCVVVFQSKPAPRELVAHVFSAIAALLAAIPLVTSAPPIVSLVLEQAFIAAIIALIVSATARDRDLWVMIGLPILAVPFLIHTVHVLGARFVWPEATFDGPGASIARAGVIALCLAALLSPYCFAPRPFARAVTRPVPVVFAMAFAAIGAILARMYYVPVAKAASLAIGVEMSQTHADPRLALYLLGIATLVWTLSSCVIAGSPARRLIGMGLGCLLLGGYGFHWPHHYLLPLLGTMMIVDGGRRVRDEELAAMPLAINTPPIHDTTWATYIGGLTTGLKRVLDDVHSLTTRGEAGLVSSVIVGDTHGLQVRTRIERIEGCVLGLDIVIGREIDELRSSTLTVWAIPLRTHGSNPQGPPAAPELRTGDRQFDERFKTRGSALAFKRLYDPELRGRAVTTLDGWLAYWEHDGLRYRVYPGKGSPLDHPMPLSDLALGRSSQQAERLVTVVELLVDIARRGVKAQPAEPSELEVS